MLKLRKKVNTLARRSSRQRAKIGELSDLIRQLRDKQLLESEPAEVLAKCFDSTVLDLLQDQVSNKKKSKEGRRYSQQVKQFALTLYYYSPQAYAYCRKIFILPNVSSIRNWLSNVECNPGFLTNVIQVASESKEREFCLVVDSMSIHKQTMFDNDKFVGFCDYGKLVAEDTDTVASEALVFLLVPLKGPRVQYPIGYFLVNKISGRIQSQLINTALVLTSEQGLHVRSVTCDGCAANISTLTMLKCTINPEQPTACFKHPSLDCLVFATLDICHMLKLARNALAELGVFVDSEGRKISWELIRKLCEFQDDIGLHLANKVTSHHVNWQKAKMKVKLAAQVFSKSVADALQLLQQCKVPGFEDCNGTINFIRQVNTFLNFISTAQQVKL